MKNYIIICIKKQVYLYKYIFWQDRYFNRYIKTYKIFSWLKPIILNKRTGKHKIINTKILINNEDIKKLIIQKTNTYQTTLNMAVE